MRWSPRSASKVGDARRPPDGARSRTLAPTREIERSGRRSAAPGKAGRTVELAGPLHPAEEFFAGDRAPSRRKAKKRSILSPYIERRSTGSRAHTAPQRTRRKKERRTKGNSPNDGVDALGSVGVLAGIR